MTAQPGVPSGSIRCSDRGYASRLAENLDPESDTSELVEQASSMLSGLTQMAGVVMLPFQKQAAIRQIEFLPLSENRVLAILVFNEHEVQNRVIHVSRPYSMPELEKIAN